MNKLCTYTSLVLALFALAACDSKTSSSSTPAADTASSVNPVTPTPSSPLPDAVPGSSPADGGTAIGGVSSTHQDDQGATKSDAPATTSGDGNGTPAAK